MSKVFVQFGAGNIGRSFLGQIFSRGGYEVVFIDVADDLIAALNEQNQYRVVIKHPDEHDEIMVIKNLRAVDGRDADAVADVLADCDLAATAVGARVLGAVAPTLANGIQKRAEKNNGPLDIILAENLQNASEFLRDKIAEALPDDFDLDSNVGLIETSIGKMVPIMREEDLAVDRLWVFAEPYNNLIVDAKGFKNAIPQVNGLKPVENIKAYVDRKLFVHNLGHSATAYLGFAKNPEWEYIYEALEYEGIESEVRRAMQQSCAALLTEYPETFTKQALDDHVEDLIARFKNRALGDTIHRVGRDLYRKLDRNDRLVGGLMLALKHGLEADAIAKAIVAGTQFRKGDENGDLFPADADFVKKESDKDIETLLRDASGLNPNSDIDAKAIQLIKNTE